MKKYNHLTLTLSLQEREERQWVFVFLGVFVPLWQKTKGTLLDYKCH
jgi:hypothetical protein